ncbi:STAS domain-containing protein [Oscillatoria sp. FACHB-1407]|uniref:STAS domain-containing protein n=1 Tax=Oscillatoria sp. FACHB-1407 TaxID=2692847 RepID=UPI0016841150|nr:STAS domain-containing protein [Oscillatoria sp. FACHB-1407]MBD2465309.1 STAS domain-containing protein [Oscillatoria sp. FACHB-1407]
MQNVLSHSQMAIIQPCGHLNAANAEDFQQELTASVSSNQCSVLLVDMSEVESLDSAGLVALVSALSLAQRLGKRFGLCGISASSRIIFELTQLDRVFEIFDDRSAFEVAIA